MSRAPKLFTRNPFWRLKFSCQHSTNQWVNLDYSKFFNVIHEHWFVTENYHFSLAGLSESEYDEAKLIGYAQLSAT